MKRFTMIVALVLMAAMPMMAERVTPETARKVAQTFLNNNGAKSAQLTDLSQAAGFANLFIFNGEQGFVVMAADDCVQPILGYSLTGKFVTEGMPENVSSWLQMYSDEIQGAIDSGAKASAKTAQQWKDLREGKPNGAKATTVVGPLIQTRWNQGFPYNNLCPSGSVTGCVATAMAQVMKYWDYPSHGIGSHSYTLQDHPEYGVLTADFNSTDYDWTNMTNTYGNSSTNVQRTAVATLMFHCGVSVDMNYGPSSGAVTAYVADALKTYFNYSSDVQHISRSGYNDATWISMLKADLDLNRPIQYHGTGSGGGHSFVCDGYNSNDYFHFNWGWGGYCDDYYTINNLNPGPGGIGSGSNGIYNDGQGAIFGVHPSQCAAAEPTNLSSTISGLQNITLNWTAADGAVSYNIYRNNILVGNTVETTYTEVAPFGDNVYYVRSVDANGELSLSSNTCSVYVGYQYPVVNDLSATVTGNTASLSWTAPDWCYPETSSATLNYGTGNVRYSWTSVYYAHRHLAANLAQYAGKAVYKVSTFVKYSGDYSVYVYTKSTQYNQPDPNSLAFSNVGVHITNPNNWIEFDMANPVILTGTDDLWVVFKQENTGQTYPVPSFDLSEHNINAFYAGSSSTYLYDWNSNYNCAWLINTYLTDGTYTYNLYDGSSQVASNINATTYTINNMANNAAHQYTVKTNYYGGESAASNMAGLTLGSASLNSLALGTNDHMTVTEGSTLTVTGAISNSNAANLVLEDGAQLVSGPVSGTMLKSITGTDFGTQATPTNAGYCLIASPVAGINPDNVDNMTDGTYDLYAYDATQTAEWRNYKASSFTLGQGVGYLYANNTTTTLGFAGLLNDNFSGISNLNYDASSTLNSLNLVGNPYAHQAEFGIANSGSWVSGPNYLTLNQAGDGFISNVANGVKITLNPMQAVLVQATAANEIFADYADNPPIGEGGELEDAAGLINLSISKGRGEVIDNAIVRFDGGAMLNKFRISTEATEIYVPRGGQDYAVAYADGQNELPVNFKAAENGTYTLSVEAQGLELDYLHLIDNMTGADVDLLAMPSYTFEAKTTDYASRFRLLFAPISDNTNGDDETFAFIDAAGNIIVNGGSSTGSETLQIVDMMGRIVFVGDAINRVSTSRMTAGVYVLRLIDGDNVRVQKIVVE